MIEEIPFKEGVIQMKKVNGKTILQWTQTHPIIESIIHTEETLWMNPKYTTFEKAIKEISLSLDDVIEAEERLKRFAPFLMTVFPETRPDSGIIESPIVKIPSMKKVMEQHYNKKRKGDLLLKCDHLLPISGSIKARGGIYEVLKHAEGIALSSGMLTITDDYSMLAQSRFKELFSHYSIAVGSTGNLGLSIGMISAKLGFKVFVHMSADAKKWKKDLLRKKGVTVIEYDSDYSLAVAEGRKQAKADKNIHFVDDENSKDLFLGYAVAALRLQKQLDELGVIVNEDHPLVVHLPCGVGGGPGGIAFGLKLFFKNTVHIFFAEPTHSPAMLLGLVTKLHDKVSVQDFGIDNITEADGLAVGRPSGFVGKLLEELISGVYTVEDQHLYKLLSLLADTENIYLEPSAVAGFPGMMKLEYDKTTSQRPTHLVWATGGNMLPDSVHRENYEKGKSYL